MENKAKEILKQYNQDHIIRFMDKLDSDTRNKLINQVLNIDFDELRELYNETLRKTYINLPNIKPIKPIKSNELTKEEKEKFEKIGIDVIKSNKFAVVTMAGGQGTRLRTFRA